MKRQMIWLGLVGIGLALLAGCATTPPDSTAVVPASRVEDGASVFFDEVVVAAPVEGAHQVYQNLHVGLAATVNPHTGSSYDATQVGWMLRNLEPRVSAATLQLVTDSGTLSPRRLGPLRESIAARVREVAAQTLGAWKYASYYDLEVSVVSMYFTDSTVGRSEPGRRGF